MSKTKLRKAAQGRECTVYSPDCNGDATTSVLCHLNGGGMALKHNDLEAAIGCSGCHAWLDGNYANQGFTKAERDLQHHQACMRTRAIWLLEGKIKID